MKDWCAPPDTEMITLLIFFSAMLAWLIIKLWSMGRRESTLPPGPPTKPIFGNMFSYPKDYPHFQYTKWAQEYGDMYSLKLVNDTVIVLSSATRVKDLLDVRGFASADRPASYAIDVIMNGLYLGLAAHETEVWKCGRKAMQPLLTQQGAAELVPQQESEVIKLTYDLLHNPKAYYEHIFRTTCSVMLYTIYGKHSQDYDSQIVKDMHAYARHCFRVIGPGALPPVDIFPFLKWIPERWANWKIECQVARKMQRSLFFGLLDECEQTDGHCYMREIIQKRDELGFTDRDMLSYHGGILLDGGTDTSAALLRSLVMCLVAFPECQREAWQELDRVIGDSRLPVLDDIESLPYVQAIIRETHRFRPVVPVNIPHVTTVEQEYDGYVIPARTTILMNTWAILHDPAFFEDPEDFKPERFLLTPNGTRPGVEASAYRNTLPFGAGRRMCPGYVVANNFVALAAMYLLWAFEFTKEINNNSGKSINVDVWNYGLGMSSMPLPFPCKIVPRNATRAALIDWKYTATI